jgi:hypothetical protein
MVMRFLRSNYRAACGIEPTLKVDFASGHGPSITETPDMALKKTLPA